MNPIELIVDQYDETDDLKLSLKPKRRTGWNVKMSDFARYTHNPIRAIVEGMKIEPNPEKQLIALSIGDPTTFGNMRPAPEIIEAVKNVVEKETHNGYGPSNGFVQARQAICDYEKHQGDLTPNDVIICSGCSTALDLCISAIASYGQNILCPRPGFSIYRTLSEGLGVEVRNYDLIPERKWEADLEHLESLIDENTAALIITNPSNPCGSVFSKEHLLDILKVAEKHYLPIIADEIYEHFVFPGSEFHAISSLSKNVPVLSCGGLTKRFLVPGWRFGWITIHDRHGVFTPEIRKALGNLSGRILGANTIIQGALPEIFANTPQSFYDNIVQTIHKHALLAYDLIKTTCPGMHPIMPDGAMYMMIRIDIENYPEYEDEMGLLQDLIKEESVFCLPGKCFEIPNYFRIVLTVPEDMVREACYRMAEFCERHFKRDNRIIMQKEFLNGIDEL